MPASARPLAAVLLLGAAVALLLAASSAITPAAADKHHGGGGGRMVIIRAPPGTTTSAAAGARGRWQRRVEDEVAPEFVVASLLGADVVDSVADRALLDDKAVCIHNCGAQWKPYVRPCADIYQSRGC